jgi:small GTP-binding protein
MLNVSSPSPIYDEENSNTDIDNSNKKNSSMINTNVPSSRPTLNNINISNQNNSNFENNLKFTYEFKIILLGSISVGKTSILSRYTLNEFREDYKCTIKSDFKVKTINVNKDSQAKLNIWDTCGDEKFRAITRQYYKEAQGILLVYDITNKESFENIDKWIEDIKNSAPSNCVIFLVGNKSDLADKRIITFQEGKNKAEEYGLLFNEVSAKNGDNILLIFGNISEAIIEQFEKSRSERSTINPNLKYMEDIKINGQVEKKKEKKCC